MHVQRRFAVRVIAVLLINFDFFPLSYSWKDKVSTSVIKFRTCIDCTNDRVTISEIEMWVNLLTVQVAV